MRLWRKIRPEKRPPQKEDGKRVERPAGMLEAPVLVQQLWRDETGRRIAVHLGDQLLDAPRAHFDIGIEDEEELPPRGR